MNSHTSATVHFATASDDLSFVLLSDVVAVSSARDTFVCCFCELPFDVGSFDAVWSVDWIVVWSSADLLADLAQAGEQYDFFFFDDFDSSLRQFSQDDDGFSAISMAWRFSENVI